VPSTPIQEPSLISLRGATLVRGEVPVLHGLRFDIRLGEHVAILGPNGSGKSSLIRLITRQSYPLVGPDGEPTMFILGKDRWDVSELRTHLGIVSADLHNEFIHAQAFARISAREVVTTGFFASLGLFGNHQVTGAMRQRAMAALDLVEAGHLAAKPFHALSTGEARRVLIARALAPDPGALLLDEPTTGLDLAARHRFLHTLGSLARHGKTLILITHHIEEIIPEVERVILLKDGRVFMDGGKAETLRPESISGLFGMPLEVRRSNGRFSAHTES
jgi:iron complex transport system ATP-binding protein